MRSPLRALARLALPALGLAALASGAHAQTRTGSAAMPFLLIEPSAQVAAMGNAGAAAYGGAMAAYYNPGALGYLERSSVEFTHSPWLAGITYDHGAAAVRLGQNTLSLAVTALDSGEMEVRTVEQPLGTGEQFSVRDLALAIGVGRRITDRFAAGLQVKYLQETVWHSSASAFALDAGVLYRLPLQGAVLGASISNFGTRSRFDGRDLRIRFDQDPDTNGDNSSLPAALETGSYPLPVFFRVGVSLPVSLPGNSQLTLAADAYQPSDASNSISLGGEWNYARIVYARGGYQNLFMENAEGGLTLGGGLRYNLSGMDFRFDYAWADQGRLGATQRFTVGLGF